MSIPEFKFLKDIPISKETKGFFDFYHKTIAPALKSIIENDSCVHTIGLFGRWGTGKSTIIKLLKEDKVENVDIVEFDCWKYEKDSLRRQLLLQIAKDLKLKKKEIDEIEKEFYFSISEKISDRLSISWAHFKKVLIFMLPLSVPIILVSWLLYPNFLSQWKEFLSVSVSLLVALGFLIDRLILDDFRKIIMISPVTATKNRMDSPELFERSFKRIIKKANCKNKIIIIIDNLDRVDSKTATEILATLKTFLEIKGDDMDSKNIVFIVPCDFEAVKKAAPDTQLADEFLRKIFNVVIWTPEYLDTDIRSFIKEQIKQTGDIKKFLKKEDVYLVIESTAPNNPREIKQFINNLISSLIVAFNSEVKEIIEKNVAYMAKILVLMHKYPTAFQNLKRLWHKPEEIITTYDAPFKKKTVSATVKSEFKDFMLKTIRITVDDAEPFIYLKQPVVSRKLKNSEAIRLALIDGDETNAKKYIKAETRKSILLDFIVSILNKYQNHEIDVITSIYRTQLVVLNNLKITGKNYINVAAFMLDNKLWPSFQDLPTDVIFEFILSDNRLDNNIRENILERYILAISTSEEFKKFQKIEKVIVIIKYLLKHQNLLTSKQKTALAQAIEKIYSSKNEIISLFIKDQNKEKFITQKTLEEFIKTSNIHNFVARKDIILNFKKLISKYKLFSFLYQEFTELLIKHNERGTEFGDSRENYLQAVLKLINEFESDLEQVDIAESSKFISLIIQTLNNISPWDNRLTLIKILEYLKDIAEDNQKNEIKSLVSQFFINASATSISDFLDFWDIKYAQELISDLLPQLQQRILTKLDFAKAIYRFSNKETRVEILRHLVNNNPNIAVEFINLLEGEDYDRIEIIRMFLDKAESLASADRVVIYDFVADKINKKNDVSLKDVVTEQIKKLLTQDNESDINVGFDFLSKSKFLSEAKKRDIAKAVLEFIRQPGKVPTAHHRNSLRAVTISFNNLQDTPQKDYIYYLFSLLKDNQGEDIIRIASENLLEIKPLFKDYKKDYKDLAETLNSWTHENTKKIVVDTLLQLSRSGKTSVEEKKYWTSIRSISNDND